MDKARTLLAAPTDALKVVMEQATLFDGGDPLIFG
jgi:hypothetical protein